MLVGLEGKYGRQVACACPLPVAAALDYLPAAYKELQGPQALFLGQTLIWPRQAYSERGVLYTQTDVDRQLHPGVSLWKSDHAVVRLLLL